MSAPRFLDGLDAISEPGARERLGRYLGCLQHWSPKVNLTGAQTARAAFDTLVAPVLGAEPLLSGDVIDVGSGNGSPGLILAALRPDLLFTLLEPRLKRWAFLREAIREMGVRNVRVLRERSDAYSGEPAATVTIRAVGLAPEILRPLLRPGGCVLIFGGRARPDCETLRMAGGARVQRQCFT